jgi:hypothetical protein
MTWLTADWLSLDFGSQFTQRQGGPEPFQTRREIMAGRGGLKMEEQRRGRNGSMIWGFIAKLDARLIEEEVRSSEGTKLPNSTPQ